MAVRVTMHQLLYNMRKTNASDLHLKVGLPPIFRVSGELRMPPQIAPLAPEDTERLLREIIPPGMFPKFEAQGDLDFSTFVDTDDPHQTLSSIEQPNPQADAPTAPAAPVAPKRKDRFRCNVFRAGGAMHAAIRRVRPDIPTFENLRLPKIYETLSDQSSEGLILVVGVTGSGKSTTLACMLERINQTQAMNIVTIEDPVEFHIHPRMSIVSQREIGTDVPTYASALKYAVRQDPDVIFIGELRDHDTVLAAVQAAETGHLVFGSLHSADTMQCFSRIVEFFPQHEHGFIRAALSASLKAVCAQRLLPANQDVAGVGVVPATEVLINNPVARERIREGADSDLPSVIASSQQEGMRSFTQSLGELVESEMVTLNTALEFAPNREALKSRLKGVEVKQGKLVGKLKG
jgi:twitching motility protein PilT